ncbi:MAG: RsmB/NOP family class I SAM-dependent RNA methyltransferase [SAR324 cluster bacterium]|nr:RsmB/NOP family class I SAM-dependent RNA methyltransferase [SAR324 cluster bacterium]
MPQRTKSIAGRQATVCLEIAQKVLESSRNRQPADKSLAGLLRQRKEQGARDRRLIRQVVFAMFRWWGWIHQWESSCWSKLLLIAYLLDRNPWNAVCDIWAEASNLPKMPADWMLPQPLQEKKNWADQYLPEEKQSFQLTRLLPSFFWEALANPENREIDEKELLSSFQNRTPLWIRTQTSDSPALFSQFQKNNLQSFPHPKVLNAVELHGTINVHELPLFKAGAFEIQDLASQGIGLSCAPRSGEQWWDVCAGGGGKSLHLAALMEGKGRVLSTEIRRSKISEIQRRAKRGRWQNILVKHWDGKALVSQGGDFDGVLVDAPCSGTGTWSRNPDARWKTSLAEIEAMTLQQREILELAKTGVKRGGTLVYATCSLLPMENHGVVEGFLEDNRDFRLLEMPHPLTGEQSSGMLTIWPHYFNSDGVFIAKMKRR